MSATPILLVVPAEAAGARLDRFLVSMLVASGHDGHRADGTDPGAAVSRAELQRWIEHGRVTVDGLRKKAGDKLREGARIAVTPEPPPSTSATAEDGIVFRVMYTDDAVVVVDKPSGLVVHPARGHATGTLVNGLLALGTFDRELPSEEMRALSDEAPESFSSEHVRARALERQNELHLRPGIVHRLDKGTSGVMVVARTSAAREALKEQFAAHTIDREYVALCNGEVKSRTFATMHGRHPTDRLRFTSQVVAGKRAVTMVRTIETFGRAAASHVSCRLETGRTHQIRMHLAENATPVLGDPLYGKPPKNETVRQLAVTLGHQALHARLLGFDHPRTGKRVRFEAPPPPDFELALETLRALPT